MDSTTKNSTIILISQEGERIQVDARIRQMSAVISDALGDESSSNDGNDNDEPIEVPCCLVNKEEIDLIVQYCSHFNYTKCFDNIP